MDPRPCNSLHRQRSSTNVTFTAAGTYELQLSANDGTATGTALAYVIVSPAADSGGSLALTPAASGPNQTNTSVALQIQYVGFFYGVYNCGNSPVQITVTGANPRTATVVTDANGAAIFSYTGLNAGTDMVTAASNACAGSFVSNTVPVTWIAAPPMLTSTPVTGRFFTADGSGVFNTPATAQPLFSQTFPNIDFNPAGVTSSVSNLTRPFTDVVANENGNFAGVLPAQGNNYQAGVGTLYYFSAVFTGSFTVPAPGPVTFTFSSDDAFIFGVGNGAIASSGPQTNTPSTTAFTGLPVMGGVNQRSAVASNSITVSFPAPGVYPYEVDYAKGGDKNLTLTMLAGGAPIPPAVLLTLSPAQTMPNQVDQIEILNVSALTPGGVALASLPVTVNVTGVNVQSRALTTDGTGQVQFAYEGIPIVGVDQIQATAVVNGVAISSNVVTVPWNNGTNQAPVVSAGPAQTIMLPAQAILSGTATDDGLPNNTLTTTWSVLSGPGPVTFDDANQPATAATFNIPGTYVLQLNAFDGALTTNASVTITVNANTSNLTTGWILSPVNNAAVSGQVPITLVSGINLVSGTLTYFPATNPQAVVTLNASATGSGQIGTFDATLLANGGYFIILNGTNSQNVTQTSQVYVTSIGDYKPGRVTATITDLTAPAPGLPIQIQRTYDSLVRGTSSDFGYGWTLGINIQTQISPTGDVTLTINGKARTFYFTPPANGVFTYLYTPQYTPEPGLYGSLANTGDNCSGVLLSVGNVWECAINNSGQIYQATGYQYTDPYGRIYTMGADGTLQSIQDLNNNTLTITPTGITSSNGLNVPFVRDSQGRITQITDTLGNQYQYAYDANGNLASVSYPSIATPAQYQYDPTHLLTQETDQRGNIAGTTTYDADGRLQSVTDAVGETVSYAYDLSTTSVSITQPDGGIVTVQDDSYGRVLSLIDALGNVNKYTYDANNNLTSYIDPAGNTLSGTYDSQGDLLTTVDQLGGVTTRTFNAFGEPVTLTDALANVQTMSYDSHGNLSGIQDSLGSLGAQSSDNNGNMISLTDASGSTSYFKYDNFGNQISETDPSGQTTSFAFDLLGRMISSTDSFGATTTYTFDAMGNMTAMTDPSGEITRYEYDANGNKTAEVDPLGNRTSHSYDAANRMISTTFPDGSLVQTTYNYRGGPLTITDQMGSITKYTYDLRGRLTGRIDAFGTSNAVTQSYAYDVNGRMLSSTDGRGNTTTFQYDASGRQIAQTDPSGAVTEYQYDSDGRRTGITAADGTQTSNQYDIRSRLNRVTTPDGQHTNLTWGATALQSIVDPVGRGYSYTFTPTNRLASVTDTAGNLDQYSYNPNDLLAGVTDANGHTTSFSYDPVGRAIGKTWPDGSKEAYTYDAAGDLTAFQYTDGTTNQYQYNSLRQLTNIVRADGSTVAFTYTPTGKRQTSTTSAGTTTYQYDNLDRVIQINFPNSSSVSFTYDTNGNRTSITTPGGRSTYGYDADNRIMQLIAPSGAVTTFSYDVMGRRVGKAMPNGVVVKYSYDPVGRLLQLAATGPGGSVATYTYGLDAAGNRVSLTEQDGSNTLWSYDNANRLTQEVIQDATGATISNESYSYDNAGNRLTLSINGQNVSYTYNSIDELISDSSNSYNYDGRGNLTAILNASGNSAFGYDGANRLTTAQLPGGVNLSYAYDADGRRTEQTTNGATTVYVWDELSQFGDVVAELTGNGAVSAAYTLSSGELMSQTRSGVESQYVLDGLNSVRSIADSSGMITDSYRFDAYGNTLQHEGSTVNPYRFRSQQTDDSTGFQFLRARYFNPLFGRFLTRDTADYVLGNPVDLNRFTYAAANPVNAYDPSGHDSIIEGSMQYSQVQQDEVQAYINNRAAEARLGVLYAQSRATYLQSLFLYYDFFRGDKTAMTYRNRTVAVDHLAYLGIAANTPVQKLDLEDQTIQANNYALGIREQDVAINRAPSGRSLWRSFINDALLPNETPVYSSIPGIHAEMTLIENIPGGFRGFAIAAGFGICRLVCLPPVEFFFDQHGFVSPF